MTLFFSLPFQMPSLYFTDNMPELFKKKAAALFLVFFLCALLPVAAPAEEDPLAGPRAPEILFPPEIWEGRGIDILTVSWSEVPGADHYRVLLAGDRSFRRIAFASDSLRETSARIEGLGNGTYFLKVRSVTAAGRGGTWSETTAFILAPPLPTTIISHFP